MVLEVTSMQTGTDYTHTHTHSRGLAAATMRFIEQQQVAQSIFSVP